MAARFARPIALARLGTSHHEPSLLARRKGTVEERSYLFGEEFRRYVENDLMKRLRTGGEAVWRVQHQGGITVTC